MGARGLVIRDDMGAVELRRFAQGETDRRAALRALAIAQALEGASRADAARVVGRERQSLRDAVLRYNAEGLAGLHDRPRSGRPEKLTAAQREELRAWVLQGPDPEADGISSYRLLDIAAHIQERWAASYGLSALSRMLCTAWACHGRRPGPPIPRPTPRRRSYSRSYIKNLAATLEAVGAAHPGKALQLWCEDEAREGQKGRTGHRWFSRGVRPPGRRDRRFLSTYIFAAVPRKCLRHFAGPATTTPLPWCCPRQRR